MQEHQKRSDLELNELLIEYCKLRHQTGNELLPKRGWKLTWKIRRLHGNIGKHPQFEGDHRIKRRSRLPQPATETATVDSRSRQI